MAISIIYRDSTREFWCIRYNGSQSNTLDVLKLSKSERVAYEKSWEDVSLAASLARGQELKLAIARDEGVQEGVTKGFNSAQIQIAKNLSKTSTMSIDEISKITVLYIDEIDKLRTEINN